VPGEVSLLAEVRRSATDGKSFAEFSLEQNGVLLDSRDLDLADGKPWTREWTFQEEGAVRYRARVEGWEGDVLGYDNSFEVAIPALPKLEAVLVSEPDRYLEAALASIPAFEFVRVWPPDSLKYGDANKLWIFQGALPPKDFQAAGLVLIAPGESGFFGEYAGPMSEPWITEMDSESELLRMVAMDRVSVGEAFEYLPKEGATAYVSSAGRPLLFGRWNEPSRWVVFGFRPSKSDLVTKAAFPLLMSNLVQSLRGDLAALAMAEGASPALTELVPRVESGEPLNNAFGSSLLPARPLWWWLVFAAMVWLFLEWWTYHRRITE
jgi:hypothetical protein